MLSSFFVQLYLNITQIPNYLLGRSKNSTCSAISKYYTDTKPSWCCSGIPYRSAISKYYTDTKHEWRSTPPSDVQLYLNITQIPNSLYAIQTTKAVQLYLNITQIPNLLNIYIFYHKVQLYLNITQIPNLNKHLF